MANALYPLFLYRVCYVLTGSLLENSAEIVYIEVNEVGKTRGADVYIAIAPINILLNECYCLIAINSFIVVVDNLVLS